MQLEGSLCYSLDAIIQPESCCGCSVNALYPFMTFNWEWYVNSILDHYFEALTDWLTSSLIRSMQHSPSSEANSYSIKKFPTFYGTWRFITMFTRSHHWFLSLSGCIQSTPSMPISLTSIIILSSNLLTEEKRFTCIFSKQCTSTHFRKLKYRLCSANE